MRQLTTDEVYENILKVTGLIDRGAPVKTSKAVDALKTLFPMGNDTDALRRAAAAIKRRFDEQANTPQAYDRGLVEQQINNLNNQLQKRKLSEEEFRRAANLATELERALGLRQ